MSSSHDDGLKAGLGLIVSGGGLLWHALTSFKKARLVEDIARIDIGSAPMGLVEIEGYAWPQVQTELAVCGREVVFYHFKVQEYVSRGKNSYWETKHEYNFNVPFLALDGTGACIVDPILDGLEVRDNIIPIKSFATDPVLIRQLIGKAGLFSSSYRVVEKKILVGSPVYVCGDLKPASGTDHAIRAGYKKFFERVRAVSINPVFRMQKFDYNHDGKVTDEEELVGFSDQAKGLDEAATETIKVTGAISNSEIHPILIADCHQTQLLARLKNFNSLKIIGSIAMIVAGAFILLQWSTH